jgi:hypothetical protein
MKVSCDIKRLINAGIILAGIFSFRNTTAAPCPCDIYEAAGTPCVSAHSTVRALYEAYDGPLYQIRRTSDKATKDIGLLSPGGYVNMAEQESFLDGKAGTISIIYDQSPNKNDLPKAPPSLWQKDGGTESKTSEGKHKVNGYNVNGIYVTGYSTNVGYRNVTAKGLAINDEPEAMYMVVDGKRYSDQCCFNYGNVGKTGTDEGNATMECIYWGSDITWGGKGDGSGPWIAADLENGVYKGDRGGWQSQSLYWPDSKSIIASYATAMLKGYSGNRYVLKGGDAQSGKLTTMWDGARPRTYSPMKKQGQIVLGTGGDGSNGGTGTFFEGCITKGVPSDDVDEAIQENIVAAGYGNATTSLLHRSSRAVPSGAIFKVRYHATPGAMILSYTLSTTRSVTVTVFDQQGRQTATITKGRISAGRHEARWETNGIASGAYVVKLDVDGRAGWAGRITVGK